MLGRRRPPRRGLVAVSLALLVVAVLVAVTRPGSIAPAQAARPPEVSAPARGPLVAFLGDSWTAGAGATGRRGYAVLTAEQLHGRLANLGVGGSGYSVPGPHHDVFADRIPRLAALHPDLVVVQGSLNERHSSPAALRREATQTLERLRAALGPSVPVLVLGAAYNPGTAPAIIDWINDEIGGAAERAGLPFVDPATAGWTDPQDSALWWDTIHPDDRGHRLLADHLVPTLRALLRG